MGGYPSRGEFTPEKVTPAVKTLSTLVNYYDLIFHDAKTFQNRLRVQRRETGDHRQSGEVGGGGQGDWRWWQSFQRGVPSATLRGRPLPRAISSCNLSS